MNDFDSRPWLASYGAGVPHTIPAPTETLVDMIWRATRDYRPNVALEFFGGTLTYEELREQIARAANGLRALGVGHGDRVALVLPNSPEHIVAFYAVLRLGAIVVEHNPLYTERELRHQFEDHGAKVAIVWDKVAARVLAFPPDLGVTTVISIDITRSMPLTTRAALRLPIARARTSRDALTVGSPVAGAIQWATLQKSKYLTNAHPKPSLGDTAVLQYTSGTTGTPKGAILSHANLRANAMQGEAWVQGLRPGEETFYGVLPMFHAYGLTLCLTFAMSMGARLVLFPRFDPDLVLAVIKKRPPTFLPAVPPIYERLQARAAEKNVSLAGIQIAISGAMPLRASVVEPWEAETGGFLVEGYGLSETSPVLMANPVHTSRVAGTVGLPLPSTQVRVVDPENPTVDVAPGDRGELIVTGPQVMSGYWNKPKETAEVFTSEGWFRTGDIVTIDEGGFIRIVDRIKELVITGGFNVSPSEVEEALNKFAGVAEVAVLGMPSEHSGEDVVAAIVLKAGASLDESAINAFARETLTAYKVPRRYVVVESLPKSIIGKVLRRKLREQIEATDAASAA